MSVEPINSSEPMSYIINLAESFETEVRRIINDQVHAAIASLSEEEDVHKGIHDARRCLKIVRAAWRLIRMDLPPDDFQRKNVFYRNAGRRLSELRDLTALLETLEMLQKKNLRMEKWVSNRMFRQLLEEKRTKAHKEDADTESLMPQQVAAELSANHPEISQFQLSEDFPANVLASLRKVYGRGYSACADCTRKADPERMHEWRKRSKYLRYHFQMLRQAWPPVFDVIETEFHQLTDYLGDFNNLTVMKKHVNNPAYDLKDIHRRTLLKEADRHQQKLWQASIDLGVRLYAEPPKAFARRMAVYLEDIWQK